MPFKSEAQRKYLWANEPGIARDWTDKHGSRIAKALGGRIPFSLGSRDKTVETQYETDENVRTAKVNDYQKTIINNQLRQGKSLQEIWEAAKQFDSFFSGMTKEEFNSYVNEREKVDQTTYGTLATGNLDGIEGHTAAADNIKTDGTYRGDKITMKDKQGYKGPNIFQRGINRANEYNRSYNRVAPGANVTPWGGGGNLYNPAVQGRRNKAWMNSIIGNYTMGIGGTQNVKQNLINKYGTVQQQQNFADAIARKTHNPYANYDYFEGQGVDKADITADVTGMYTDSGSSGMDDIGDVTAPTDSWSDTGGTGVSGWSDNDNWGGYIARGGMVKDAPRYRYAEGGIVNLLPKGAW